MWFWMVVAGLGIGPTLAAFTIIVQNAAPFAQLGRGDRRLTFFRQVGGTVGLAIGGTLFGIALVTEIPRRWRRPASRPQLIRGSPRRRAAATWAASAGSRRSWPGARSSSGCDGRPQRAPRGVQPRASPAPCGSAWAPRCVALVVTAFGLPELPLRRHHGPVPARVPAEGDGSEPTPMAALE